MAVLSCIIGSLVFILFIFIAYSKDLVDTRDIKDDVLGAQSDLQEKEAELLRLKQELRENNEFLVDKKVPSPDELLRRKQESEELTRRLAELGAERERLLEMIANLESKNRDRSAELDDLKKKAAMLSASRTVAVTVRKQSQKGLETPIYVECRLNEAMIWPAAVAIPVLEDGVKDATFEEWLTASGLEVPSKYVIFLIRTDGVSVFDKLRRLSEASGWAVGYEPVLDEWELFFGG